MCTYIFQNAIQMHISLNISGCRYGHPSKYVKTVNIRLLTGQRMSITRYPVKQIQTKKTSQKLFRALPHGLSAGGMKIAKWTQSNKKRSPPLSAIGRYGVHFGYSYVVLITLTAECRFVLGTAHPIFQQLDGFIRPPQQGETEQVIAIALESVAILLSRRIFETPLAVVWPQSDHVAASTGTPPPQTSV